MACKKILPYAKYFLVTLSIMPLGLMAFHFNSISYASEETDTKKLEDLVVKKTYETATEKTKNFLDPYFDHLELNMAGGEKRKPDGNLIGVIAYDNDGNKNSFFFNQLGLNRYDGRSTLNIGLGYRTLTDDDKWMFGANLFYDHEFPNDHQRSSVGIEARSSVFNLSANTYNGISGYKSDRSGTDSKALGGNDAKLELSLPYLPETKLTYRAFKWNGIDGASDSKGYTFGLKGYITENLLLELGRTNFTGNSSAPSQDTMSLTYQIRFGEKKNNQFYLISNKAYEFKSLGDLRYEPVQRENRIIKQKKFATTVSGV